MTRTILIAQEFGDGLGHVTRLIAVARGLPEHRLVFAVPNEAVAGPVIAQAMGEHVPIIGGTGFSGALQPGAAGRADKTLADVLHRIGYGLFEKLDAQARKWGDIIEDVRPDLIIADFAPTLRLVSCGRVPAVVVGDGFATPPSGRRLPPIDRTATSADPISIDHEKQLLNAARRLRKTFGGPRLAFLADLFGGERVFPISFADIDPYGKLRDGLSVSPFTIPEISHGPIYTERRGPPVFCFLWLSHPTLNTVITALNGLRSRAELHVRGMDAREVLTHCAPHVGVHAGPPRFADLLPQTGLFIHYGGAGATYAALLAGVMQLILPTNLEQEVTAAAMVRLGVATALRPGPDLQVDQLRGLISNQLGNRAMQEAVLTVADQQRKLHKSDALPAIWSACAELLGGARPRGPRARSA